MAVAACAVTDRSRSGPASKARSPAKNAPLEDGVPRRPPAARPVAAVAVPVDALGRHLDGERVRVRVDVLPVQARLLGERAARARVARRKEVRDLCENQRSYGPGPVATESSSPPSSQGPIVFCEFDFRTVADERGALARVARRDVERVKALRAADPPRPHGVRRLRRRRGYSAEKSRATRECDVDIPWRRVAATPRPRRGHSVETESRRRRGRDVDIPWRKVAATPRPRRSRSLASGRPQHVAETTEHAGMSGRSARNRDLGRGFQDRRDASSRGHGGRRREGTRPRGRETRFTNITCVRSLGHSQPSNRCRFGRASASKPS